jgi:hypothetical protein
VVPEVVPVVVVPVVDVVPVVVVLPEPLIPGHVAAYATPPPLAITATVAAAASACRLSLIVRSSFDRILVRRGRSPRLTGGV